LIDSYAFGLLFVEPPPLDTGALVNRLRQDGTVDLVSASDEVIQVAYPEHLVSIADRKIPSLVNIIRWANPVKPSDFKSALEQTYDWAHAEETVSRCRHKVLVADLIGAGLPYQERYELLTAVLRAVVEVSRPDAIHWEPADCIMAPESLARRLSFYCNVRLFEITKPKGNRLMDTMGLTALGLVDVQCLFRELDASKVALWLYQFARQTYGKGDFVKDGEALPGIDAAEHWVCRHQLAMAPPSRAVIDVTPSAHHAGKR
jgi:uncharacterized protein DUF4261